MRERYNERKRQTDKETDKEKDSKRKSKSGKELRIMAIGYRQWFFARRNANSLNPGNNPPPPAPVTYYCLAWAKLWHLFLILRHLERKWRNSITKAISSTASRDRPYENLFWVVGGGNVNGWAVHGEKTSVGDGHEWGEEGSGIQNRQVQSGSINSEEIRWEK